MIAAVIIRIPMLARRAEIVGIGLMAHHITSQTGKTKNPIIEGNAHGSFMHPSQMQNSKQFGEVNHVTLETNINIFAK